MIIGTVHSLQGAQCPIVLFSTVNSPEDHSLFMERDGKYNMLNVAISRAQHHFIVFGNMNIFHPEENTPAGNMAKWLFDAPSNEISNNFIYQQEIPLCTYHPTLRLSTTEEHVQTLRQAFEKADAPADCISIHIYPCHRKRPADSVDTAYGTTRS